MFTYCMVGPPSRYKHGTPYFKNVFPFVEMIPFRQLSIPRLFHVISIISDRLKDDIDLLSLQDEKPRAFATKPKSKLASYLQTASSDP